MKILTYLIVILYITSCNYPDIDSVPDFKDVKLTKEELFDLCQISVDVKSEIDRCIKEKQ
jgi:hypothetical protein